jgi:hypothetical protein
LLPRLKEETMRSSVTRLAGLLLLGSATIASPLAAQTGPGGPGAASGPTIEELAGNYDATLEVEPANCAAQRVGGRAKGPFRASPARRGLVLHLEDLGSLIAGPLVVDVDGSSIRYDGPIPIRVGPVTDSVRGQLNGTLLPGRRFEATFQLRSMLCSLRGSVAGIWAGPLAQVEAPPTPPAPPASAPPEFVDSVPAPAAPTPSDGSLASLVGQEVSLQAYNYRDRFIRHRFALGYTDRLGDDLSRNDATFRIAPGLAGSCISLESRNFPNHFLRHQDWRIRLAPREDSALFRQDATFCLVPGLADGAGVSFESVGAKGHFIRHRNNELWVDRHDGSDLYKKDATFLITQPGGTLDVR